MSNFRHRGTAWASLRHGRLLRVPRSHQQSSALPQLPNRVRARDGCANEWLRIVDSMSSSSEVVLPVSRLRFGLRITEFVSDCWTTIRVSVDRSGEVRRRAVRSQRWRNGRACSKALRLYESTEFEYSIVRRRAFYSQRKGMASANCATTSSFWRLVRESDSCHFR